MENTMFYEIENEQLFNVEGGNVVGDAATILGAGAAGAEIGGAIGGAIGGPGGAFTGGVVGGAIGVGCGVMIVVTD
ncbi:Blp family class II bacteriocin [Butyrivibrio sp. INlla21]|uniref:Blp family class II bacteriocin n=1 Tax=Butyrivibrio sp. INlla21 TaxID=1520811 RepID=UPI0008EA2D81|nr:Blp family class II bacteriocin [Butyrivibrio sp. INlla21]SFU83796.1 Bacteriocin class II with double-glycine leader peptide [Butyrivibrio sp. INlla21]